MSTVPCPKISLNLLVRVIKSSEYISISENDWHKMLEEYKLFDGELSSKIGWFFWYDVKSSRWKTKSAMNLMLSGVVFLSVLDLPDFDRLSIKFSKAQFFGGWSFERIDFLMYRASMLSKLRVGWKSKFWRKSNSFCDKENLYIEIESKKLNINSLYFLGSYLCPQIAAAIILVII